MDASSTISMRGTTPFVNYGNSMLTKTLSRGSVGIAPKGSYDGTFKWVRDDNTPQTHDFSQAGSGDVLGPASENQFTLGTSTLSGAEFSDKYMELEEGGEFRAIQYEFSQNVLNEDLEVHNFSTTIKAGAISTE